MNVILIGLGWRRFSSNAREAPMLFKAKPLLFPRTQVVTPALPGSTLKGKLRSIGTSFRAKFPGLYRAMESSHLRDLSCGFRQDIADIAVRVLNLPAPDRMYRHRLLVEKQLEQILGTADASKEFKDIHEYRNRYARYLQFHETNDFQPEIQSFRMLFPHKEQQLSEHPFTVTSRPRSNKLFDLVEFGFGRKQPSEERVMKRYKGYIASVRIDEEKKTFVGKIEGINDLVTFSGDNVRELEQEFEKAVDSYIRFCNKLGKDPEKKYSGNISLRTDEEMHQEIAIQAAVHNVSVNSWLNDVIKERLKEDNRMPVV